MAEPTDIHRMNELETKCKKIHTIRLSDEARARMRAELSAYADLHEVSNAVTARARSPFYPLHILSSRMYAGLAIVVLMVASVAGTAYASTSALPGDALYSVKVGIAEPLQTALIPSPQGKAVWHAMLAERRLEEATKLAADNKLTPAVQQEIATNLDEHVAENSKVADQLEAHGQVTVALSLRSDLEARLAAHEQILNAAEAHFAEASSTDTEPTKIAISQLLDRVAAHERATSEARIALEDALVPTNARLVAGARSKGKGVGVATTTATSTAVAVTDASTNPELATMSTHGFAEGTMQARPHAAARLMMHSDPETAVAIEDTSRAELVQSILVRNQALLAKFLPEATTSASTTATTTASTTAATTSPESSVSAEQSSEVGSSTATLIQKALLKTK